MPAIAKLFFAHRAKQRGWVVLWGAALALGLAWLSAMPAAAAVAPPKTAAPGVPEARFRRLTRGVNIAWFRGKFEPRSDDDLKLMKQAGIRHVRLSVGAVNLFNEEKPETPLADNVKKLDSLLDRILAHDLAVIVQLHDADSRLWNDDAYAAKFARFWRVLAKHLSRRDPERVFLESLNEPSAETAERWNQVYPRIMKAMRQGAPRHTLIASANQRVTANEWDSVRALELMRPVAADRNIVYNFHTYAPMEFTHQTATWGWDMTRHIRDLPYPSTPVNVQPVAAKTAPVARDIVLRYGEARWNAAKLDALARRGAAWAKKNRVRLTCNEFGVYRPAPADSRNRYLRDMRIALEKNNIGWAMWEWSGGFGMAESRNGRPVLDPETTRALGLIVVASAKETRGKETP